MLDRSAYEVDRLMCRILLRGWLLRLRLLLFFIFSAEDLLEEVFLLGRRRLLRGVGRIAVRRSVRCLPDYGCPSCSWRGCSGVWSGRVWICWPTAAEAEDLLKEILWIFAHLAAGIHGCGAVEEPNIEAVVWAA